MTSGTNEKLVSVPSDCPEYVRCNAPICPLDARWLDRTFSSGEPTCLFLRESVKKGAADRDRKSTRLNSSHSQISYAVFCLKKKKKKQTNQPLQTHNANQQQQHQPQITIVPQQLIHSHLTNNKLQDTASCITHRKDLANQRR